MTKSAGKGFFASVHISLIIIIAIFTTSFTSEDILVKKYNQPPVQAQSFFTQIESVEKNLSLADIFDMGSGMSQDSISVLRLPNSDNARLVVIDKNGVNYSIQVVTTELFSDYSLRVGAQGNSEYKIVINAKDKYLQDAAINKKRPGVLEERIAIFQHPELQTTLSLMVSVQNNRTCRHLIPSALNNISNKPKVRVLLC